MGISTENWFWMTDLSENRSQVPADVKGTGGNCRSKRVSTHR